MKYTIGQAARMTGRSKATIWRAVKAGKLTCTQTMTRNAGVTPTWVEWDEVRRLFPPRPKQGEAAAE
ncbi:MAG: hypothetical protein ACE368_00405 [Paracoccaceae bacterium]